MTNEVQLINMGNKWITMETIFVAWATTALAVLLPATFYLEGSFPLFTLIWLVVPLLATLHIRDVKRVGFRGISWLLFLSTIIINLAGLFLISILVEPWSHAYQALVRAAVSNSSPDTTFAWLVHFDGVIAWGGLFLYSGLVTIFAEELFFRGWLLQALQRKMNTGWAIVFQAALFTLPQVLAALSLPPVQGLVYAVMYSWVGVGLIGGWAATRTQSILPSLVSATIWNAIMIAWVF